MLTVREFIKLAADRGVKLEVVEHKGRQFLTNGRVAYPLIQSPEGWIPDEMRDTFCRLFGLPYLDFALDERPED